MDNRKPLCTILWVTQILFVLLAVGFMSLWVMNELGLFGTDGVWFLTPERSGAFEPIISILTFVFVGGNYFVLQTFCAGSDKSEPSLGGPKKLTNHTYRQYIRYRFRDFNVKGLSTHGPYTLELARVYVELSVAPKPFHAASSNIVQLPEKLQSGRHDIWAYLQQTEQNFAIIGPPGSGKTTLLSHIALTLTQSWFQRRKESVPNKLPILLTLLEHAEAIATDHEPFAMEDAVRADLRKWKKEVPEGWVRHFLDKGKYLVLLDGLDEVADKVQRQKVVAWVERQMKAYPMCQFIVTSRPHGYQSNPIVGVTTLEIRPYDNRQQAQFIRKWYLANEVMSRGGKEDAGVQMAAKEGADDLLRRLGDAPNLAELAVNPLLLTMIATVHRFRSALPKRRVELYDEIFSVFLGTWRGARGIEQELTPDQRKQVLQPLAWVMMHQHVRQISADEAEKAIWESLRGIDPKMAPKYFLEIVRYQSGLLVEKENGFLAFAHLTFQEYLAAMHVQNDETLLTLILGKVRQSWWHETLLLYAAKKDATPIIEACINTMGGLHPEALMLVLDCNEEASQIAPETRERLENVLAGVINGDEVDEIRQIVAETWLKRRLKRLSRISEDVHIDSSLITHVEFQLFLDEKYERGDYSRPAHWHGHQFPHGMGQKPVVGMSASDAAAFCEWLTEKFGRNFNFRLPTKREAHIIDGQVHNNGYWIQEDGHLSIEMRELPRISIERLKHYRNGDLSLALTRDLARARNWSFDLACDLIPTRDHVRILARDIDHVNANTLLNCVVHDLDLARDLVNRIKLARNLIHDLGKVWDSVRSIAPAVVSIRARAQALDHAFAITRDCAKTLANDFDVAQETVNNLDIARNRVRDIYRNLSYDDSLVRAFSSDELLDGVLNYHLTRYLVFDHAYNLSRVRTQSLARARDLVRALAFDGARDMAFALARARDLARDINRDRSQDRSELRGILYLIGFIVRDIQQVRIKTASKIQKQSLDWQKDQAFLKELAIEFFDSFVALCILEERIIGNMVAFEGIRIVRERVKET